MSSEVVSSESERWAELDGTDCMGSSANHCLTTMGAQRRDLNERSILSTFCFF